jgi:diguanylate cyclase (GGDEF)-like protein
MKPKFYQNRVLYILITVLISIQIGAFVIQVFNHRRISDQTLRNELRVGHRVVQQILSYRNLQLQQVAELLAKDYGFLEAFSTAHQDKETIESVLENHRSRSGAGMILLSSLDHQLIAQSPTSMLLPAGKDLRELLCAPEDKQTLQFSSFELQNVSQNGWRLFHVTHSKLKAPTHLADLTVGYEVDNKFLQHLRQMTNLDLIVISRVHNQWMLNASTVQNLRLNELLSMFESSKNDNFKKIQKGTSDFLLLPTKISSSNHQSVYFVIAKPTAQTLEPFKNIERVLYYLLAASIFVSVATIYIVTKRFVEPLSQEVHTDILTGIGNRRLFTVMIERALRELNCSKKPFAILLLDLNKFKQINDRMGHDAGDYVLKCIAERIKNSIRATDSVARLGGDEYAVLLEDCNYPKVLEIVNSISFEISQPINYLSNSFNLNASIGVTLGSESDNIDSMLKRADEAMYEAKSLDRKYAVKLPKI